MKNINGTRKRIDYERGYQCILPTNKLYWRKAKDKYKQFYFYNTRYQSNYHICAFAKVKGHYYYNYRTKEYLPEKYWIKKIEC